MAGRPQLASYRKRIKFPLTSYGVEGGQGSFSRLWLTSKYAEIVIYICSPFADIRFRSGELCNELSHAASNRNMHRSSPGISKYSPGNNPNDKTEPSVSSSSSDSGVLRIRPVHNKLGVSAGTEEKRAAPNHPPLTAPTHLQPVLVCLSTGARTCARVQW